MNMNDVLYEYPPDDDGFSGPQEIENEPNGEWICPKCGHTRRTYRGENDDNAHCVKDGKAMIWKPEVHSSNSVWCWMCEVWVEPKDFVRWTGDDSIHYLCPGCDSDMREPERME